MTIQNWLEEGRCSINPAARIRSGGGLNQSSRRDHVLDEVLAANRTYAAGFCGKGKLAIPRARRFAIFTCMDAQVIRNAWGRASSAAEPRAAFSGEPGLS